MYLKVGVLSLSCVLETYKKESINSFELDPAYYLSSPGYSWDAMLRFTDINVKLISDIKKYQFFESMLMGGISMIFLGYEEANRASRKFPPTKIMDHRCSCY